jgi:alcohol dehydrogenase class IV
MRGRRPRRGPLLEPITVSGWGAIRSLGEEAERLGFKRTAILTTGRFQKDGPLKAIMSDLETHNITPFVHSINLEREKEGTIKAAKDACSFIDDNTCDSVIAIGGGSVMDVSKAAAAGATAEGGVDKCIGTANIKVPTKKLILVPTTAGTGSESTAVSVLKDGPEKRVFYSLYLLPALAVVDPALTVTMGAEITRDTGMDALCHAIESFASPNSSYKAAQIAKVAVRDLMKYLPIACNEFGRAHDQLYGKPENTVPIGDKEQRVRSIISDSAHLAGVALTNSGPLFLKRLGKEGDVVPIFDHNVKLEDIQDQTNCPIAGASITHMIGLAVGPIFGLTHGHSVGMVLPESLNYMLTHGSEETLAELASAIGLPHDAKAFINAVKTMMEQMEVPQKLPTTLPSGDSYLSDVMAKRIAKSAWAGGKHRLSHNLAIPPTEEDLTAMVKGLYWDGVP